MSEVKYKYKCDVMEMFILSHNELADIIIIFLKGTEKPIVSYYRKEDMDDWMHKGLVPSILDQNDQKRVENALIHYVKHIDIPTIVHGVNIDLIKTLHTRNGRHFKINKDLLIF